MKVSINTQVYNAKKYIRKCIESVLNQTLTDFEYIVIDNGCTDGTSEILNEYAEKDKRIKLYRNEVNRSGRIFELLPDMQGEYYAHLDADDWIEPDFLERLVNVSETTGADIVYTGTKMHFEATGGTKDYCLEDQLVIDRNQYAAFYTYYHWYLRHEWGLVAKMDTIKTSEYKKYSTSYGITGTYALDTLRAFCFLDNSKRLCIDNTILQHYTMRSGSISYNYNKGRIVSDIYMYNHAIDFLSQFGPVSEFNMEFIRLVYANAINDTYKVISKCDITDDEMIDAVVEILDRDVTLKLYNSHDPETTPFVKKYIVLLMERDYRSGCVNNKVREVIRKYLTNVYKAYSLCNIELISVDQILTDTFVDNDIKGFLTRLADMLKNNEYVKKYDIESVIKVLVSDNVLLNGISHSSFIKKYHDIFLDILSEQYIEAVNMITLVLEKEKCRDEGLIWVYLSLTALLEMSDKFVFGKQKSVEYYYQTKQFDKCKEALNDLSDMNIEDTDKIKLIRDNIL